MLGVVSRRMRLKSAFFLAALYALTVLVPNVALAFAGPDGYVHCLSQEKSTHDHAAMSAHKHADGPVHGRAGEEALPDSEESQGAAATCCGLFFAPALTSEPRVVLPAQLVASRLLPFPSNGVDGQGPGRIIRPPIA
jgi:hypothetical protein